MARLLVIAERLDRWARGREERRQSADDDPSGSLAAGVRRLP
jgi:hypothetical protein